MFEKVIAMMFLCDSSDVRINANDDMSYITFTVVDGNGRELKNENNVFAFYRFLMENAKSHKHDLFKFEGFEIQVTAESDKE